MATQYFIEKQKLIGIRYMLLAIAFVNALISIIFCILQSFSEQGYPIYLQALITGILAYVIPIVIYAKTNRITAETAAERFYMRKSKPVLIILALLLGICCQFVMVVINLPVNMLFGDVGSYIPEDPVELMVAIFVIGVIPAIFEEFLFRGIVVGSMAEFNTKAAMIFSSVMFAALHADVCGFLGYLFMGFVLTMIVRRSDSIYPAMVFHFASNVTALILGYCNTELVYAPVLTITIFAVAVIGFFLIYTLFASVTKKPKEVSTMKLPQLLGQSFMSVPIILCIVIIVTADILMTII